MLNDRVFGKKSSELELEPILRSLVAECGGHPLMLLFLAGLLSENNKQNELRKLQHYFGKTRRFDLFEWRDLFLELPSYCFSNFPFYLKPCFLYFAGFQRVYEIRTRQLYQLWIAEGFIPDNSEATAEEYLEELVDRGFVQVVRRTSTGRIKTCCLHDIAKDLSTSMASREGFIEIVHIDRRDPSLETCNRLSIGTNSSKFLFPKCSSPYLHSLLCLTSERKHLDRTDCHYVFENFKLLRLLDLGTLVLDQCPIGIDNLLLLRYLKLNIPGRICLSSSLGNLLNLYTLDMPYSYISDTPDDFWRMKKLKHLNCGCIKLPAHPGKYCSSLEDLNFISVLHPSSCTRDILSRSPSLQSVHIYGDLGSSQSELPNSLYKLICLEYLELKNISFRASSVVLEKYKFPPTLTHLILSETNMKDDPMPTLEKLQHLKVLQLKQNSYSGRKLACGSGGFPQLKVLHLKSMLWLQDWTIEKGAMPKLECLIIDPCAYLRELPMNIWGIETLHNLELGWPQAELRQTLQKFKYIGRYDIQIYSY